MVRVSGRQTSCIAQFVRVFPLAQSSLFHTRGAVDASEGVVRGQRLLELTCLEYRAHLLDSLVVVIRLHGVCEAFPGSPEIHWELVLQASAVGAAHAVVHGDVAVASQCPLSGCLGLLLALDGCSKPVPSGWLPGPAARLNLFSFTAELVLVHD